MPHLFISSVSDPNTAIVLSPKKSEDQPEVLGPALAKMFCAENTDTSTTNRLIATSIQAFTTTKDHVMVKITQGPDNWLLFNLAKDDLAGAKLSIGNVQLSLTCQ